MTKDVKEVKNDQAEAMEIVEDEATKQQRLVKETITGKKRDLKRRHTMRLTARSWHPIEIKRNFTLLERAVETIESRFTTRVLRTLPSIRRRLTDDILAQVISDYFGPGMIQNCIVTNTYMCLLVFLFFLLFITQVMLKRKNSCNIWTK